MTTAFSDSYLQGEASAATPVYTPEQVSDQLTDGYWNYYGSSGASWDIAPGEALRVNIQGLTPEGQFLATSALLAWTFVSGIEFVVVTGSADITFDDEQPGAYASMSWAGGTMVSASINVSKSWLSSYGTTLDSYSFQTYIHEIGHALGLGHAGNYNGSATYGVDNHYANDSWQMSVMSYFSQSENTYIDADFAYVVTPMIADILAIQALYGTAGTLRTEDTTYGYNSTAGGYYDDIVHFNAPVAFTLIDDGGIDRVDFSGCVAPQVIDLRGGAISDVLGLTGNMIIMPGTVIENATGGSANDTLIGNGAGNDLSGGAGRDRLAGLSGGDTLSGAQGGDRMAGGGGADELRGDGGNDRMSGGAGSDILIGGRGNDTMKGGGGADTFWFGPGTGSDVVLDFYDGIDRLRISGVDGFGDLTLTDETGGCRVSFLDSDVLLAGVLSAVVTADDFVFV